MKLIKADCLKQSCSRLLGNLNPNQKYVCAVEFSQTAGLLTEIKHRNCEVSENSWCSTCVLFELITMTIWCSIDSPWCKESLQKITITLTEDIY